MRNTDDELAYQPAVYPEGDPVGPGQEGPQEDDFAIFSKAEWDEQTPTLEPTHQTWIRSLLFLAGHQWWERNRADNTWSLPAAPDWRERPISNLAIAHFKTWVAKILKNKPASQAIAASDETSDIKAKQLADEVIASKFRELRFGRILRRLTAWMCATGNGHILPFWNTDTGKLKPLTAPVQVPVMDPFTGLPAVDPDLGEPIMEVVECPCDETGQPYLDENGMPDLSKPPTYVDEGEVGFRVISPFQVRVNPDAECDEEVNVVLIGDPMTMREIEKRWPDKEVVAEDVAYLEQYDQMLAGVAGAVGDERAASGKSRKTDDELPKALVLHRYERQSPRYPEGRYWVTAGNVLLEGPTTLPDALWPPIVTFRDIVVPGRWHGKSSLEDAIGLNREYNELNGKIKEAQNAAMSGAWVVEKGSGVKKGNITTEPHLVIEVTTGFINGIKHIARNPVPADLIAERQRLQADFELVSGIRRISMGEPPPGVTSGIAFLQLEEADNTDLGPVIEEFEEGVADVWHAAIRLIQAHYTEERLIRVSGPNRSFIVKAFRGSDLEGVHDVVAVPGSAEAWSKVARQNLIMELGAKMPHLFQDEMGQFDRTAFIEKLEIGGLESLTGMHDIDLAEAHREEDAFQEMQPNGEVPEVMPWQNHIIHIKSHERILKGAEFNEWPVHAQMPFVRHYTDHVIKLAESMAPPPQLAAGPPAAAADKPPQVPA